MGIWYICFNSFGRNESRFISHLDCVAGMTAGGYSVSPSESFLFYPTWENFEEACK